MSPTARADLCRVTIVAPGRRIDLSLPAEVPLAHMLPTLLRVSGNDLADRGLAHAGWVLQRIDEPPLDTGKSLTQLGVRDGEILHFRPRMALIPEMAFDDVADVVATGKKDRSDRWHTETTRRFGLGTGAAALAFGVVPLLAGGPPWRIPAILAGMVALLLVLLGSAMSRAVGDSVAGAVLGYSALPYAFVAGLLVPARPHLPLAHVGAPHLLTAFAAVTVLAVLAGFGIADGMPWFIGMAFAALIGTIAGGVALAFPSLDPAGVAAATVAIAVALSALIPTLSFRFARVPLPPIPANAEDLRSDATVVDGQALRRRTITADRFATGLVAGIALIAVAAHLFLAFSSGWPGPVMSAVVSVTLLLRARIFRGRSQRGWMLIAGLAGFGVLGVSLSLRGNSTGALLLLLLAALVIAAISLTMGMWLPGHRPTPFWGRAGDIVDAIAVVALIPLALAVLHVYSKIRGLGG
ncbi:type VII secretion integral membrane protein EccD [Actinoallomurus soli]|uniref:type VII secretion integral membrane protein EccD n=1 Tax=Actinoallomurus soli TaxID=2952535 RepID=UPI002092B57C|nr:type VII secretion integral membrane protein EccD [Actinoallomurus soli]MCO5968791.1 type VII secretion integral membrane protein EccD [Actinoallomurus soli]